MSESNELRSTPERRILGELGNSKPEPISPTANLRLLTTLASNLNNVSSNVRVDQSQSRTLRSPNETGCSKLLPRKEKSLSLLCNKFLNLYPLSMQDKVPQEISLNTTAKILNTEKRRIYDIINVLESLEMASKAGKNQYLWHGQSRLPATLTKLKMLAIKLGLKEQIQEIQRNNRAVFADDSNGEVSASSLLVPQSPIVDYCLPDNAIKEDKSLGVMCQKFVMLFLISLKNGVINLDIAAKVLISEPEQSPDGIDKHAQSQYKTKVRRLYDIANVLSAIGLIEKVDLYNCTIRKPIFKYKGPHIECNIDPETPIMDIDNRSIVGMATPSKNNPSMIPRATNRYPRLCLSITPTPEKREPRKRKLFGSDDKFSRTNSASSLDGKIGSLDRLDDSILQVAEMELKRIRSNEDKPKVCTKLFPRHNSDSCITTGQVNTESDLCNRSFPNTVLPVSKENLVNRSPNVTTPLRAVRINVPWELKLSPYCIQRSSSKFVKLANFDAKKLVPLTKQEVHINLPGATAAKPNFTILTKFPTQTISPGDTFKAVKIGNTVQLVPMGNHSSPNQNQ